MEWVSMDDRWPQDGQVVLTYPGWATSKGIAIDEWCGQYQCFLMSIEDGHKVTHWMPLPNKPKT